MFVRNKDQELAQLLDQIPDSLTIVKNGQLVFVNAVFRETFEVYEGEIGDGIDLLSVVHKDDRDEFSQRFQDRLNGKPVPQFARFRCITLRGKELPCEESGKVIDYDDGKAVLFIVRVITEQIEAERQLQIAHEQLELTIQALPDLFFELDFDGVIHDFRAPNPGMLYVPPEEFLGKKLADILPHQAAKTIMQGLEQVKIEGRSHGRTYSLEIKGEECWFELSATSKSETVNSKRRVVCLVRDITDRKKNEQALTEKNIALNQILEHMDQKKEDYRKGIRSDISGNILPLVKRLRKKALPECVDNIDKLEDSIKMILATSFGDHVKTLESLTSRESQICEMIKDGMSTKEISNSLNLSEYTVSKHREHIRDKLGIRGRAMSLSTYLRLR